MTSVADRQAERERARGRAGNLDGQRVWLLILKAVNELLDTRPGDGVAVH